MAAKIPDCLISATSVWNRAMKTSSLLLNCTSIAIRTEYLEAFRLVQPQPELVVPRLFQPLLQLKVEALEVSIMRFGALEGGDRQLERAGTADAIDILVA